MGSAISVLAVVFALVFLLAAQGVWLLRLGGREEQVFTVTREGLREQSGKIRAAFERIGVGERDMAASLLLLEEVVMRLERQAGQVVTARVRNFYGRASLRLSTVGPRFNPLERDEDAAAGGEDFLRGLILHANAMRLSYRRSFGRNVVVVRAWSGRNRVPSGQQSAEK